MNINVFTTFPKMFAGPFDESIIKNAVDSGLVTLNIHDIRDYSGDKHKKTDDTPYGGGGGMIMMIEPIVNAIESVLGKVEQGLKCRMLLTSPQGRVFNQVFAKELAQEENIAIICGHYKGIDERVGEYLGAEEISIGDFVLTGGELPAMLIIDSIIRLIPGVVGNYDSVQKDSFYNGILDCPYYTKPRNFRGLIVPEVLLSGNHSEISRWQERKAYEKTLRVRQDLIEKSAKKVV